MLKNLFKVLITVLLLASQLVANSFIEFESTLSHSKLGLLKGEKEVTFRLYSGTSTTAIWTETQIITFIDGKMSAQIGNAVENPLLPTHLSNDTLFIGIEVDSEEVKLPLSYLPLAIKAKTADSIEWSNIPTNPSLNDLSGSLSASKVALSSPLQVKNNSITLVDGTQGPKGDTGLTGAIGATGTNGATWLSGNTPPNNNDGTNGDFYLDTVTHKVYKKVTNAWREVTDLLGTIDATPLIFRANNLNALQIIPNTIDTNQAPNIIMGFGNNSITGIRGSTIGGGGSNNNLNSITGEYATISGGKKNVSFDFGTIPGGFSNVAAANSFAAGTTAEATQSNAFVWSDGRAKTISPTTKTFTARADNGVTYEWIDPKAHGNMTGSQMGFIAQDIEKVLPQWVLNSGKSDEYLMIHPVGIDALIIESIKTLEKQNNQMTEENRELRERLEKLENKMK